MRNAANNKREIWARTRWFTCALTDVSARSTVALLQCNSGSLVSFEVGSSTLVASGDICPSDYQAGPLISPVDLRWDLDSIC